jgi:hypothetical protein
MDVAPIAIVDTTQHITTTSTTPPASNPIANFLTNRTNKEHPLILNARFPIRSFTVLRSVTSFFGLELTKTFPVTLELTKDKLIHKGDESYGLHHYQTVIPLRCDTSSTQAGRSGFEQAHGVGTRCLCTAEARTLGRYYFHFT